MKKNNLKPQPKADQPRTEKNLSKKPLQKRQVSFGVLSAEKNPKSETLVIAREPRLWRGDRSNLRDSSGLLLPPRRDRNDKGANGNDKGVMGRKFEFRISNFKSWHKISVAVLSLGIIAVVVFFQFLPQSARSKTFTFFQTAWSSVLATVAVLTAYFGHAMIKSINPPRAYFL